MIFQSALILFVMLTLYCGKSVSLTEPQSPCPNIFRYSRGYGDVEIGLIRIWNFNFGENTLEVDLSQPGTIYPGDEGYLDLNTDEDNISENIESGRPIAYTVYFPIENVPPQVIAIYVNGKPVCYGQKVSGRSTTITLKHTFTTSGILNHRSGRLNHRSGSVNPLSDAFNPRLGLNIPDDETEFDSRITSWIRSNLANFDRIQNTYPRVPCPHVFRYVQYNDIDTGLITIAGLKYGDNVLEVELSQPGSIPRNAEGYLTLGIHRQQLDELLRSAQAIPYKVNFPLRSVIPQVSAIRLNGDTICRGSKVRPPSTTMTLKHTLTIPKPAKQVDNSKRFPSTTFTDDFWSNFDNRNRKMPTRKNSSPEREDEFSYERRDPLLNRNNNIRYTDAQQTRTTISPAPNPTRTSTLKPTTERSITLQYIDSVCGEENLNFVPIKLIVKGVDIPRARFPWIVAIYKKGNGMLTFQCGGSLISTRTVISAAHCFYTEFDVIKNEDVLVSFGRHNLTDWSDSYITHSDVENIIRHPDYRQELINLDADLAIVQLKKNVKFSQAIRPVCLWQGTLNVHDNTSGIVVGWGRDENNSDVTTTPKLATALIVSEETCKKSNEQLVHVTSNRTLCAGYRNGTGPCNGDSGSGLMIQNGNKWMLRGTVSASLGDAVSPCNLNEYVVYTDIAMFIGWIKENMLL